MKFSDCNVTSQADYCALCGTVTEIVVDDCCCNEDSFNKLDFSRFGSVEQIRVGSYSFRNVLSLTIHRLPQLKEVKVGCDSFTSRQKTGNVFCLKNCKGLKELKIGHGSFSKYSACEISNLDELEVIEMGTLEAGGPFSSASLKLKNLPKVKILLFGTGAFCCCIQCVIENLPELTSIHFGWSAFSFKSDDSSKLIMRNLPKLTTIVTEGETNSVFSSIHSIVLENIPSLTTISGVNCFSDVNKSNVKAKNISPTLAASLK
ncbi:hypothetical protein AV274_3952 [Blastocystis sp. ATCC 50177/Nand II]|uniref:Uncharacterized protein n=1 Tax=Blastocystis sp. subtype 1 (strain ATCC 50177 / NandII) TaxID=478820 RepID=A0A196SDZ9_BLAHN|nr:hypothetical protein AV274_3952 [Blastocystis sp. ATCC 50177/Nand II]